MCKTQLTLQAGCGGILRNEDGHWLGGFAKFVGHDSAFIA